MALYLPRNLAALATVAAKENPRYAVTGVRVLDPDDGTYRLEATDGRRLAIVRGYSVPEQEYPELQAAPAGADGVVVGRDDWQRAFKLAKVKGRDPAVGFAASTDRFTFVSQGQVLTGTPVEGRWPPVDSVLPRSGPLVQFRVDPALLASLLDLRKLPAELAAINLQWGLERAPVREDALLLAQSSSASTLRSLTSTSYGRIWDYEVVDAAQKVNADSRWQVPAASYAAANPKRATTLYASDRDVFLFLVDPKNPVEVNGETLFWTSPRMVDTQLRV